MQHARPSPQEKQGHEIGLEMFCTQEGVKSGLQKAIIDNAPEELLVELEDDDLLDVACLPQR